MKVFWFLWALTSGSLLHGAEPFTNYLSIHLLAEGWNGSAKPEGIRFFAQPLLSDSDFLAFDVTRHTFTLTKDATQRLLNRYGRLYEPLLGMPYYFWDGRDTPFVLVASGEPIYVGLLYSPNSSRLYLNIPKIVPSGIIAVDVATNALFGIELTPYPLSRSELFECSPKAWLSVDQVFEEYLWKADVRNDPRVISAAQKLLDHEKP